MDLKDTYNRIAENWHKDHQSDTWWAEGTDAFLSVLPKGALVLDVGCGGGFKSRYLSDKGMRVMGIDFAENMIAIARREVPHARFEVRDMRDVPGMGESFDGIFVQAALLHIPKAEALAVLRGFVKKLNPGGYLYVATKGKRESGPDEQVVTESDYGYEYERFFSFYSVEELEAMFAELGLTIVFSDVKKEGSNWVQVIGRK